jgi:glycine/D-amino acid oxidase-like deaminating enzyme
LTLRCGRIVIGGGLQGCCIALELARRGADTIIVEQDPHLITRASLRNEGKIHLGLVYAADPSFATASLLLQGALTFHALLRRWLGNGVGRIGCSTPFVYLVALDSLLSADILEEHYARTEQLYRSRIKDDGRLNYLDRKPDTLTRRLTRDELAAWFNADRISAGFATEELAIDPAELASEIRAAVHSNERITVLPDHRVDEIQPANHGVRLAGTNPQGAWSAVADQVINCTWVERFRLDKMMGFDPLPGWVHRLKYRMLAEVPARLRGAPSATMVLGPYGDVVIRSSGMAYLSWYPAAMRGWSHATTPPEEWAKACRGETDAPLVGEIAASFRREIDLWYPGVGDAEPTLLNACVILAYGVTDVDDAGSQLHRRTRVGVSGDGVYLSVDPGKLTTAPLFAVEAADRALGCEASSWG